MVTQSNNLSIALFIRWVARYPTFETTLLMKPHTSDSVPKFILQDLTMPLTNGDMILHEINLRIPSGQITCLIGPSGSGKSTLLRCLNRLLEPPPATIMLDDVDITTLDVLALRRRVGMLFQTPVMFPGTVADNVAYGPKLHQQNLTPQRLTELLEMVGLDQTMATKSADTLSGGQAQRVCLARALANEPEVLLLDEPTSALDPAATLHVEETIHQLQTNFGLTVVWVSHFIEQVERMADFVALLVDGKVLETGTPAHLLSGEHHHLTEDFSAGKLASQREER